MHDPLAKRREHARQTSLNGAKIAVLPPSHSLPLALRGSWWISHARLEEDRSLGTRGTASSLKVGTSFSFRHFRFVSCFERGWKVTMNRDMNEWEGEENGEGIPIVLICVKEREGSSI